MEIADPCGPLEETEAREKDVSTIREVGMVREYTALCGQTTLVLGNADDLLILPYGPQ